MLQSKWNFCDAVWKAAHFAVFYILFSWFTYSSGQLKPEEKLKFKQFDIWPGVTLLPPESCMRVSYLDKIVTLGNYLHEFQIMEEPVFLQWPREVGAYYILFLLGPDVPTNKSPHLRHVQHWVITNIPGNRVDEGDVMVEYVGVTHHYLPGVQCYKKWTFFMAILVYTSFPEATSVLNPIPEFEMVRLFKDRIVPDLAPAVPNETLIVTYKKGIVYFGNEVDKYHILKVPDRIAWKAKKGKFYTLIVTGSDAPEENTVNIPEYLHWLVGNIPEEKWWRGENVTEYQGLLTGFHYGWYRVVFFLFEQPKEKMSYKVRFKKSNYVEEPWYFSTKSFAETYKLGNPVALNYCVLDFNYKISADDLDN